MTALQWILSLRPALPMSIERPCTHASNSEVKRWMQQRAVIVNGEPVAPDAPLRGCDVGSLVFFPKGARRTTLF
jgi:hypothetical protein